MDVALLLFSSAGILSPIANVLGAVCNFIFNTIYTVIDNGSFAITIIIFTIVIKALLFPLGIKQQKSMVGMRRIQPEQEKIQKKYKNAADPEIKQKMNMEISELYRKNKVNPLSGCLPLLLQLPILYALFFVLREPYYYISVFGDIYGKIAQFVIQVPNFASIVSPVAHKFLPQADMSNIVLESVLFKFTNADWNSLLAIAPADVSQSISELLLQKNAVENLFTISLVENSGMALPGIIIPLLAGLATLGSSLVMNRANAAAYTTPQAKMQMKIMTFGMPIMMMVFAVPMPAGLGVYWIMSSLTSLGQQLLLNKLYPVHPKKKVEEIVDSTVKSKPKNK